MNKAKQLGTGLEKRLVAKARQHGLDASKQPLSGVLADYPSDVVIETLLAECKVRSASIDAKGNHFIRLDLGWLSKVREQATKAGFEAGIVVVNAKGSQKPLVLVDLDFLLDLVKKSQP